MAEPSKVWVKNNKSVIPENLGIENDSSFPYNQEETIAIRSRVDATVKLTGTISGKIYIWSRAGTVVDVDIRDKDEVLNKKRGRVCCGGQSGKALFEIA